MQAKKVAEMLPRDEDAMLPVVGGAEDVSRSQPGPLRVDPSRLAIHRDLTVENAAVVRRPRLEPTIHNRMIWHVVRPKAGEAHHGRGSPLKVLNNTHLQTMVKLVNLRATL